MSETSQSHELHTPYSSQMLSDLHIYDTNRTTIAVHTGKDDSRSGKNYITGNIDDVIISNTSSSTSFSPFMSALELSPFLTSSESTLSTDYVWHEENIPRFDCAVPEFHNTWSLNKEAGVIPTNPSKDDDDYNMIPQFDGTSDEPSSSHKQPSQNRNPPVVSQHTDGLQSRSPAEHQSSRSNSEAEHPFGMLWNSGAAGRETGNPETYVSGRRTQQDVGQKRPHQQQHQWFQHQQNMPTLLLPSSPAASIHSPTHNPHASPRRLAIPTPSPPHLQPQSPAYNSAMASKSHQHPYQSPSQYPYLSPQSNWGFHSPHQPYKSPSANQSFQSVGETSESFRSELANKSYLSPTVGEAQAGSLLWESPCSSHQSSPSMVYQAGRDQLQDSTYQSSSQAHEGFQPQRCPHACHPPRDEACSPDHSVWGSHTCSTNSQVEQVNPHSLKSCQTLTSSVAKSHLKAHYSSNDLQTETSHCQSDSQDCMFPQDLGNKSTVTPAFCHSSVKGEAHVSVQKLKPNPTLLHPADKQRSVRSSVNLGNIGVSSKASTETAEILSSAPNLGQILIEEPGQIHTKRDKQMAFIKKIIDSPTPPMPGQRYRVRQSVDLLGRSRSTSLSSPVSPVFEHHTHPPPADVNSPVAGQHGVSQTAPHSLSCESRRPSPMHSTDWQCWKEQNFPPGSQWHERQSFDSSHIFRGSSVELNTNAVSVGSRLQQTSFCDNSVQSSSYENSLQQNILPLLSNTQDTFQNNLRQSLQIHSSSACTAMMSEHSSSSSTHHLVSHVDSGDVHQGKTLASSVPIGFSDRNYSCDKAHIPGLSANPTGIDPINARAQYRHKSDEAGSEPTGQLNSIDLSDLSYLKPESISRSGSLDSIHFQEEKEDMNRDLVKAASPYTDTSDCSGVTSPTYTIVFQVPTTISKNLSNANIRTDDVEVVRMRPVDADSNSLVKIGCEVVKAVKLSEVDLEGYVGGELSQSDIIPSYGSTTQIEMDTTVVGAHEHHPNDREKVPVSTFSTSLPQNISPDRKSLNTGQTNDPMSRASPAVNCFSPVDSAEWMHGSTDRYLTNYKQKINIGLMQSGESLIDNLPYANKSEDFSSLHQMSPSSRSRQFDSQLPGTDSGNLFHQLNAEQDSSNVHSVSSSSKDKYHAGQKENICKSHVPNQKLHQHGHQHQLSPAHLLPWQRRPHSKYSLPGVEVDWHPTDQHGLASRSESETVPDNICDEGSKSNENTFGSSRCDHQRNVAHRSGHTPGQQHGARSTLNQPCLGHISSGRCESSSCKSTYRGVHNKHSGGVDRLDETSASDASRPDQLEETVTSSSSTQASCEEDIIGIAHNRWPGNDSSEQPEQQFNEFVSQHGERKIKLSSRKNVKALCLTIPKPRSRTHSLDLDRRHASSDDTERASSVSSHRDLADNESNSNDKLAFLRTRRCSRLEDVNIDADGRHSPRKTTMQSAYAKSAHVLKLKKRKTAESLIEGVHYMVIGKFRGHKAMLVKTKKLNVTPTERVKAEDFEKSAAQEVVRVVSPVSLLESRIYAGDSESSTYPCDVSESESDTYSRKPHVVYNNSSIDHPLDRTQCVLEDNMAISELDTVKEEIRPDSSRSRTKSKNIFTSFTEEMDENSKWSRGLKEDSKNIFTSFSKEMGEDNEWSRRLREDQFFFRFKESFIKHCKGKEDVPDSQLQDHENIFFEGVKRSSFCNFQQKFLSNIQKLKSGDYSSSSDDEDDVLDETILKKRIGLSHRPIFSQVENGVTPLKPLKLSASEGRVWNHHHPDVQDAVCTCSDQNSKRKHSLESPGIAENRQEKLFDGLDPALDNHIDAHNEERCNNQHINKCTSWTDRFQEGVETEKDRPLLTGYENERNFANTLKLYESEKITGSQMKGYESEKITGSQMKGYESEKITGSQMKGYDSERFIDNQMKGYESEKITGSQMKGYESEKITGSQMKGYESEKITGSQMKGYESEKINGSQMKGYDSERFIDNQMKGYESEKITGSQMKCYESEKITGSQMKGYESEKITGSQIKGYESEKFIDNQMKGYESEKIIGSQMKGYENEKSIGSTLKGYESERCIGSILNMENTQSSVEINTGQSHIYHENFHEKSVVSNGSRDEEAREDYLKCQMAFFEDISSDSESNDTIIMDNCMGKGPAIQRGTTTPYPPLSVVDTGPNKLSEIMNTPAEKSTLPISSYKFRLQEGVEQRCFDAEQAEVCESMQNEPEFIASGSVHGPVLETSDRKLTQVSIPSSEFTQVFRLTSQQKDTSFVNENDLTSKNMLYISQDAFEEEGQSRSTFMGDSDTEVEADISKLTHSNGSRVVNTENTSDAECMFTKSHHKKKRHRKSVKKMKPAEASSGTKGRQKIEGGNSNCQNEVDSLVELDCLSKNLPERKKTFTYYTKDLDSDEDVCSDSSDEDFTVGSSRRKFKINRKSKGRNIRENPRKLPKVSVDSGKASKKGQKGSSSRGRKRKAAGGDKLLSSLSLLHMATLANLTETPSDLLDQPSASETTMYMQDDSHSLYFTDNSLSSAPDETLSYLSQYSREEDPPFVDSKRWKLTRKRKSARESTALSKKLLKRQTNLKYGHTVASDASQNPASLSRLVNNFSSSSPVPSNFTFSHISDTCSQAEAANLCEDAGPNIALQLLETRRAQVNCASFSMKDILRLTTPDDSMDSDSRDSSAHARFSASKKAQVKSTTLSMSDILKLTNTSSHSETVQIPISGHMLLANTDPLISQPAGNSVDTIASHLSSQVSKEATRFVSSSNYTQTEGSQISASFRSHFKQFDNDSHQLHTQTESSKAVLESSDSLKRVPEKYAKDPSIEPASYRLVEGTRSWIKVGRKPHKKSVSDSDLLQGNTVGILSNPDSKVKTLDTAWCLGNMNNRYAESGSESETCVNRLDEEPHERANISSSVSVTSSSVLPSTVDTKPTIDKTVSTPPALNTIANKTHTTSFSTLMHPSRLILKPSSTSKRHRDKGGEQDSLKTVGSHRVVFTATTGKDPEVTGVSSPSVNFLEEFDKLNYETIPAVPSLIVLEASVPDTSVSPVVVFTASTGKDSEVSGVSSPSVSPLDEFDKLHYKTIPTTPSPTVLEAGVPGTSVFPVVKTARLSAGSGRAVSSQKVSCSSSEALSTFSKQENKGNHKNMNVRNTDRGVKPLHPLQIPHYSLVDQKCHPQVGHVHNAKNSSQYYPHCWQWPVHTPGSDATVSPLNLCTSHKSPNNYSPITPTSPVSPDYPTQAQGVIEFDKSPRVPEGKPLWYPWLKVEPDRSETRLPSSQTSHKSSEEYKMQMPRTTRLPDLLPLKQSDQEGAANVFREPAQVESHKVKHDGKASLDVQRDSPSKSKDQLSSASKSGFVKPLGGLINTEAASFPGTAIDPSCRTGGESFPSASCSETLAGAEINGHFEISTVTALNIK